MNNVRGVVGFCLLSLLSLSVNAAIKVELVASPVSPQPIGTTITFTAAAADSDPGTISYRFSVGASASQLKMARDFSTIDTFPMALAKYHGIAVVQVTARNNSTLATVQATMNFRLTSRLSDTKPVANATANPLVALFSAPACAAGSSMRVRFLRQGAATDTSDTTRWVPCAPPASMNFYVAGMRANSSYNMRAETATMGAIAQGPTIKFQTGNPSVTLPTVTFPVPPSPQDSLDQRVLLVSNVGSGNFPTAFDLDGYPIWYYQDPAGAIPLITRPVKGTILLISTGTDATGRTGPQRVLREIDLAGNILRETNVARISEQLVAVGGQPSSCQLGSRHCVIGEFHHEAIRLPNGHTVVMASTERIFTDGTQGSSVGNPIDVIGDLIIDLDTNWQVTWFWNAFDHLDVNRVAVLGETCVQGQAGCPTVFLATLANDWLHGNAIDYVSDGSLLFSMRHQDQVVKIDFGDGAGTGKVVWTLGLGGDFAINSNDPYPWFSHQHDVGFDLNGTKLLSLFDNGNTRRTMFPTSNSRGYVLSVDQSSMTVTPILLADLGAYSFALGSASRLLNGNYHFLSGILQPGPNNQSIEVLPDGTIGLTAQISNTPAYRSFRMLNLYSSPDK